MAFRKSPVRITVSFIRQEHLSLIVPFSFFEVLEITLKYKGGERINDSV